MDKRKKGLSSLTRVAQSLGPGLITGASDDDPSGIATYSQAGAQFGFTTLWTALITLPLMISIQEMCARIGLVTAKGLMAHIKENYSPVIVYFALICTVPAIILNIGSDIAGMGAVSNLILPIFPSFIYSALFTVFFIFFIVYLPYKKIAAYLKYLCISLLAYLIVPFLIKQPWLEVIKNTFIPHIKFNKDFLSILVAIFGTTISPYLFFWQTIMEAEEQKHTGKKNPERRDIPEMKLDVTIGMLASNIVMYFIIFTTGSILYQNNIHQIDTVEQAAKALEPLAGKLCYFLFSLGILGTGLLSIPVLCSASAYLVSAAFDWEKGLDKKLHQAKGFYSIIIISCCIAFVINLIGVSPIKMLIYTAILYGLTAPLLIFIILLIANNKRIMKADVNGRWSNLFGVITFLLMSMAAIGLLYLQLI